MKMTHMAKLEKLQIIHLEETYTSNHNPAINGQKYQIGVNGLRYRIFIMIDGMNNSERVHNAQRNSNLRFIALLKTIPIVS